MKTVTSGVADATQNYLLPTPPPPLRPKPARRICLRCGDVPDPGKTLCVNCEDALARELKSNIGSALSLGFWFCHLCEAKTQRVEDRYGSQICGRCGSPRIEFCPPLVLPLTEKLKGKIC